MDVENEENDQNLSNKLQPPPEKTADGNLETEGSNGNDTFLLNKSNNDNENDDCLIKKPLKNIIDSDSEEDDVNGKISGKTNVKKRLTIIDSDSEDAPTPHNKSFDENLHKEAVIYMASRNGELVPEDVIEDNLKRLSKLCDSDNSADEEENASCFKEASPQKSSNKSKPRKLKEKIERPKKMTGKEALQQRREIRSESQRMTREMNVSLPYHRPKIRTLKEFLERRPKLSSAIPNVTAHVPPAVALKMTTQQLEIVTKNISERGKQVEDYFKSESEPEEENDNKRSEQTEANATKLHPTEETKIPETNLMDIDNEENNKLDENITSEVNIGNNDNENEITTMEMIENTETVETTDETISTDKDIEKSSSVVILNNVLVQEPNEDLTKIALTTDQINPEEGEMDALIEKYNNQVGEESTEVIPEKKKNVTEIIKEKLGDLKPELSKTADFINLDENVNQLMQRFIKHTAKRQSHKHNVHLDIVNVANGEIHKEKLEMLVEDDTIPILEKPGERLKKLRDELENKIAEQRSKLWQEKMNGKQENDEDGVTKTKTVDSEDEDILDRVDEDEFTEIEDDEDGDEIIGEDDDNNEEVDEDESDKKKNVFLENEAEESDCNDEDMDTCGGNKAEVEEEEDENNLDADDESEQLSTNSKRKKKLRRIIQVFENDSDDENSNTVSEKGSNAFKNNWALDTTDTVDDLSGPTPHQKQCDRTPIKPNATQTKSDLGFLTPVIQLTGLQSLNSGSKFLHDSPVSPFTMPKTSPSRMSQSGPQKKLFYDDHISDSQTLDDFADICSGKFPTQTLRIESKQHEDDRLTSDKRSNHNTSKETTSETFDEPFSTTQDFLEICSGKFTGITQPEPIVNKSATESGQLPKLNLHEKEIGDNGEIQEGPSKRINYTTIKTTNDEIKNFDDKDDERLISQLLDEDELERFKKKFDSPEKQMGRKIFDSDDDNEVSLKKKRVKNCISDEEHLEDAVDETDSENYDGEEAAEEEQPHEIEYDSEENEIDVTVEKKKLKVADFFEKEAELSESEWGSADEDEKDLDMLDFEEGDNDKLNESKVKRDLERIHMRHILDDDNREVKMLQEILLDDGELHGTGRERQFKWRNIDSTDNNDESVRKDDDVDVYLDDENENEEQWRKMRFEREIFLKKQQESSQRFQETTIEIESNSQIFKLGQAAMKRSLSNTPNNTFNNKSNSPDFKASFTLANKKGSFLSRSEQVLARVAELTSKAVNPTIGRPKNSRNFVFHTVQSTTEGGKDLKNVKKRKATEGTPAAIKKLRLNTVSPAVKKTEKSERVKKLFSNW